MSKSKTDDERPTVQLACWIRRDTKNGATAEARKRGLKLNQYVDRAVSRQLRRDAEVPESEEDESDS